MAALSANFLCLIFGTPRLIVFIAAAQLAFLVTNELCPFAGTLVCIKTPISLFSSLFVVFNEEKMYKGSIADLLKVENRDVVSTIPSVKERYEAELRKQMEQPSFA